MKICNKNILDLVSGKSKGLETEACWRNSKGRGGRVCTPAAWSKCFSSFYFHVNNLGASFYNRDSDFVGWR